MEKRSNFSRTKKSISNAITGLVGQILQYIFHFSVRTAFIYGFGKEYLGLNGLFTNILSILNITELGLGTAIIYQLYTTVAIGDLKKTKQYLYLYKKIYKYIGFIILAIGISALPALPYIIKEDLEGLNIKLIYIFYLMNSVFSYCFFAYRNAIVIAYQEQYRTLRVTYLINILSSLLQIGLIIVFKNIYVYLLIPTISTIIANLINGILIGKWYPFILEPADGKLSKSEVSQLKKNVYSLLIHKISYIVLNSTDNIILSMIAGVVVVGLYSNYVLIVGAVLTAVGTIFVSLTSSIGNLHVVGTVEKKVEIYQVLNFANFWLYGFSTICLYVLLTPFINLWIGPDYLIGEATTAIICFNYLANGLRQTTNSYLVACGLFYESRFAQAISSVLNILFSLVFIWILLPYNLSVFGVLLGTIISQFLATWWYDGWLINKKVLNRSPINYYKKYWEYILITGVTAIITKLIVSILPISINIIGIFITLLICIIIVNLIFFIFYRNTREFEYLYKTLTQVLLRR